ncbi:hypothetical protein [Streptomyces sp. IB201691-2A2]|uniref:hypothetical protein n=1 Tax=Streptomyces sp. IB201691-2A2 TaxID=2561920 RepID=UPI00117BF031|nr:hypothetical protein [Streptomyces sp. IB201691-2A2]TRO55698.1 hypothetical protein E4K73_49640 [Streptomyces sp. IB201691-2A2]
MAGAKTDKAQDRYLCELATRVTNVDRARSAASPVERLAQQRTEILHLEDLPQRSDHFTTIAPYSVWITYRLEAGATEHTRDAAVFDYRVLALLSAPLLSEPPAARRGFAVRPANTTRTREPWQSEEVRFSSTTVPLTRVTCL